MAALAWQGDPELRDFAQQVGLYLVLFLTSYQLCFAQQTKLLSRLLPGESIAMPRMRPRSPLETCHPKEFGFAGRPHRGRPFCGGRGWSAQGCIRVASIKRCFGWLGRQRRPTTRRAPRSR